MGSFWSATHAAPPDGAIVPRAEPGQSEAGSSSETSSSSGYSSMPALESSGCSLPALERESSGPYESWNHPMIYGIIGTESGRPIQIVGGSTRVEAMRNLAESGRNWDWEYVKEMNTLFQLAHLERTMNDPWALGPIQIEGGSTRVLDDQLRFEVEFAETVRNRRHEA